jgi:hypothetical protein
MHDGLSRAPPPPVTRGQCAEQGGADEKAVLRSEECVYDAECIDRECQHPGPALQVSDLPLGEQLRQRKNPGPPPFVPVMVPV